MTWRLKQDLTSKPTRRAPVYEPIVPSSPDSFVWRCDDYPLPWSVWNQHPECEIHLIRHAAGTRHVGDHIGPFSPGDLCLIGRNLPHDWFTPVLLGETVAGRDIVIQFDEERLLAAAESLPELVRLKGLLERARRGLVFHGAAQEAATTVAEAIGTSEGLERLALLLRLLHILSVTPQYRSLSSANFTPNLGPGANDTLRDVLRYVALHYHEAVTLADLAGIAHMTESSFSRFFKRMTGNTFTRHLTELRTAKACELLAGSDRSVTDICFDVGYRNLSNFNRAFRSVREMTPRQYRQLSAR